MKIYRMVDSNANGVFRGGPDDNGVLNQMPIELCWGANPWRHPCPSEEGLDYGGPWLCGCISPEQLDDWFNLPQRRWLQENGREIRIFEVPDDRVNVGATQVTFDSCHVTVLDIIRPLDLPVARF
ncbi:MAG: hypothetical protein KDK08_05545 [Rhizobiaceae bacterium]|nr:hypothetical protein [Rhizobiaceae bacterium]MCC0000932.1 hypothetical protein [Methylobacteriaceae bacterium]